MTDDIVQATAVSLFPALRRIEENGWVPGGAGPRRLVREQAHCHVVPLGVTRVLEHA